MWVNIYHRTPNKTGLYRIKFHYPDEYGVARETIAKWDSEIFLTNNLFIIIDAWFEEI